MKKNMGKTDSIVRIVLAVLFGALYFSGTVTGILGLILMVLAIVFLLTSFIRFCPLYLPFGLSTCEPEEKNS